MTQSGVRPPKDYGILPSILQRNGSVECSRGPVWARLNVLDELISAVASRYGFRATDYAAVWDGEEFNAKRDAHELVITIKDGRKITLNISKATLGNPWGPLRDIEDAFRELRRRGQVRGE